MQEHLKLWQGKVEAFNNLQEQHSQLQKEHSASCKDMQLKRRQVCELFQGLYVHNCAHFDVLARTLFTVPNS